MEIEIVEGRDQRTDKLQELQKTTKPIQIKIWDIFGFIYGPWISDKEDCPDENAEIKIEVIENDIEPKTEPELIDLQATEESYQVC